MNKREHTADTVRIEKYRRIFETETRRFIVNAEIKPIQAVAPYLTVDLEPVPSDARTLSITANIYARNRAGFWEDVGGGQCQEELKATFPDDATVQRLCAIWDRYHLGEMNAGTREQQTIIDKWRADNPGAGPLGYERICTLLEQAGKLYVPIPEGVRPRFEYMRDKDGNLPTTYRYGSAWLSEPLPAEIAAEVRALMTPPSEATPKVSPEQENRSRWTQMGIKMSVSQVDHNPNMPDWLDADHYKCTLSRGRAQMTVYFSKGYGHKGVEPTIDEVLETLVQDAALVEKAGDFAGFCRELGYDEDSRKAERCWKASKRQTARLKTFLGEELYKKMLWNS